jgi:pantoate--beta-alanine ligase
MKDLLINSSAVLRDHLSTTRGQGNTIGLVPTMGSLHAGHGRLMEKARAECEMLVVSIFVNPLQFGPGEDFKKYPRNLTEDLKFCEEQGADFVFAPLNEEMYPEGFCTSVEVEGITEHLCGPHRPGHFKGVATVVLKLLNIVLPDRVYFGEKDLQQLRMIERMVFDLSLPVAVVPVPTVREADGLALSSRNRYLNEAERQAAPALYRALCEAAAQAKNGTAAKEIRQAGLAVLQSEPLFRVEYLDVVDDRSVQPVKQVDGAARIAAAAWLGSTRLIDNVSVEGSR